MSSHHVQSGRGRVEGTLLEPTRLLRLAVGMLGEFQVEVAWSDFETTLVVECDEQDEVDWVYTIYYTLMYRAWYDEYCNARMSVNSCFTEVNRVDYEITYYADIGMFLRYDPGVNEYPGRVNPRLRLC